LCCYEADDAELDVLAKLVEQEVNERQSNVIDASVAEAESRDTQSCSRVTTESSACSTTSGIVVDVGSCALNSQSVVNTEAPVTETDEQCQYFLLCVDHQITQSLWVVVTYCFTDLCTTVLL